MSGNAHRHRCTTGHWDRNTAKPIRKRHSCSAGSKISMQWRQSFMHLVLRCSVLYDSILLLPNWKFFCGFWDFMNLINICCRFRVTSVRRVDWNFPQCCPDFWSRVLEAIVLRAQTSFKQDLSQCRQPCDVPWPNWEQRGFTVAIDISLLKPEKLVHKTQLVIITNYCYLTTVDCNCDSGLSQANRTF